MRGGSVNADTKMRQLSVEETMLAVQEFRERHQCGTFNGMTGVALNEKYEGVIHIMGRGFFVPDENQPS